MSDVRSAPRVPDSPHQPSAYDGPSRDEVLALRRQYLTPGLLTMYREPLLITQGKMQYVWDETGKRYLDALAGIVTVSVGHCHPTVVEKVKAMPMCPTCSHADPEYRSRIPWSVEK